MPTLLRLAALVAVSVSALALGATSAIAAGLTLGFNDASVGLLADPQYEPPVLEEGASVGATAWRFELPWGAVAPTEPPSPAVAADPGWSGYDWTATDQTVRAIRAARVNPIPVVNGAPEWAQGADKPTDPKKGVSTNAWRPSPAAFGAFATALATRYSGTYPDPLNPGRSLPAVRTWQVWNEPNLSNFLNPQWVKSKSTGRYVAESPNLYRDLLNAFYAGAKKVSRKNYVVTAGTAPFGDPKDGDPRMRPVRFWRELLCVDTEARSTHCGKRVTFDAIAHHPYPIGTPTKTAISPDDAVVADMWKITRLLKAAQKAGTVRPAGHKQVWATEISWDSRPDPDGLSLNMQAMYLQGALNVLWKQGVDVVTWWNLRDAAPSPSYAATLQSGVFFRGRTPGQDKPKPSATAFRFPFTAYRTGSVADAWGMAPRKGTVTVQASIGRRWVTVRRLKAGADRVFSGKITGVSTTAPMRATIGHDTSLTWTKPR